MNNDDRQMRELLSLAEGFSAVKNELKEINRKLNRMEKRLNSAFPKYKELTGTLPEAAAVEANRENLLKIFEELLKVVKEEDDAAFQRKIKEYPKEALIALALEIGTAGGKKMGIRKAVDSIKSRLRETIILSQNSKRRSRP
ncbi:MAG: hypothetical protein LBP78_04250 [Acidaminococcales bacterium]|jgi:hypothetical protein|nr:hypothetical protein [Acidaminococcales bacterium]